MMYTFEQAPVRSQVRRRPNQYSAKIMRRTGLLLALAICPLLAVAQSHTPTDGALKQALLGVWCNSDDGGKSCWGYDEYREDGTISTCSLNPGSMQSWHGAATYEVRGNYSCMIVTYSSDKSMRQGEKICAQILEITPSHQRYKYIDFPEQFTLYRRRPEEKRCPSLGT